MLQSVKRLIQPKKNENVQAAIQYCAFPLRHQKH